MLCAISEAVSRRARYTIKYLFVGQGARWTGGVGCSGLEFGRPTVGNRGMSSAV